MLKVHIRPHWEISVKGEAPLDTATCSACCCRSRTPVRSPRRRKRRPVLPLCLGLAASAEALFGEQPAADRARARHRAHAAGAKAGLGRPPHRRAPVAHAAKPGLGTGRRTGPHRGRQAAAPAHGRQPRFAVAALIGLHRPRQPCRSTCATAPAPSGGGAGAARMRPGRLPRSASAVPGAGRGVVSRWLDPNQHCLVRLAAASRA